MRNFFKKTVFIAVGFFLIFALVNILIGFLFWMKNYNQKPLVGYRDAPYLYFVKEKNAAQSGFEINASLKKDKEPDELRILVLGGSVAYNLVRLPVPNASDTNKQGFLESLLQSRIPGKKVTVINGALEAYVSEQEFIALQMHLQYYHPDIVIALHGFNDVESFRLNHMVDKYPYVPSPIFYAGSWNTPLFNIIESHKKKYEASSIFSGYYTHVSKSVEYTKYLLGLKENSSRYIKDVTNQTLENYAFSHVNIVKDLNDFCTVKKFHYLNFLQPVRFYHTNDSLYYGKGKTPISNYLSALYFKIENKLRGVPNYHSLTALNLSKLRYIDECHPDSAGNQYLAESIVPFILEAAENFQKK